MPSEYSSLRVYQTESFVGVWIRFVFWTFRSDGKDVSVDVKLRKNVIIPLAVTAMQRHTLHLNTRELGIEGRKF